jgi:hypothetical protein
VFSLTVSATVAAVARSDISKFSLFVCLEVYVSIGDDIAIQYGGSEAHKKVTAGRSESITGPIGKVNEVVAFLFSLLEIAHDTAYFA